MYGENIIELDMVIYNIFVWELSLSFLKLMVIVLNWCLVFLKLIINCLYLFWFSK